MERKFDVLSKTADLKIRVYGKDLKTFFRNAFIGMFQAMTPQQASCCQPQVDTPKKTTKNRNVAVEGSDREALLVNFLTQVLALTDVHNETYEDIDISSITDTNLVGTLHGTSIDAFEGTKIKAVSFHGLEIKKVDNGWQADVTFDI